MSISFDWLNDTNLTISDTAETIYANPVSTITHIGCIVLHNTDSSAQTITLYLVPDSSASVGTAATTNQIFKEELAVNETYPIDDLKIIMGDTNDTIQAVCSGTTDKVNIFIFGAKNA